MQRETLIERERKREGKTERDRDRETETERQRSRQTVRETGSRKETVVGECKGQKCEEEKQHKARMIKWLMNILKKK